MAKILGMKFAKAKNWTVERPFTISPSERAAPGQGASGLYSIEDLYLMGVANEFSEVGFAAKAVGRLVEAARPMLARPTSHATVWIVWRLKRGGAFHIETGPARPPKAYLSVTVAIGALLRSIDVAVEEWARN
jgi:hypothetical protein